MSRTFFLLGAIWSLCIIPQVLAQSPTAVIDAGTIVGTTTVVPSATVTVNKFLGIPYAEPPTPPNNRFATPAPPTPWTTQKVTQDFGAACIQEFNPVSEQNITKAVFNTPPPKSESEDCLYLNVWAPATTSTTPRAVMFWIYGGALHFGHAGLPIYDGAHFAALEDVIVVSVNYRTNVFGFPSSPAIPLAQRNLGFLDQRAGLAWVQRNIHVFNGDPNRVTIFGQSAGGLSVDALVTSFGSGTTPPFSAAIMESGQYSFSLQPAGFDTTQSFTSLSTALGCPSDPAGSLACVKTANVSEIHRIIETFNNTQGQSTGLDFGPVADNVTLVSDPNSRQRSGNVAPVPIMTGTNAQDGSYYARPYASIDNKTYWYLVDTAIPASGYFLAPTDRVNAILAEYNLTLYNGTYSDLTQIHTDWFFQCPSALLANTTATRPTNRVPTYRYILTATFTNTQPHDLPPSSPWPTPGAYHTSEIPLVFSTYNTSSATAPSSAEISLSNTMRHAWASFAKDPRGAGPGWVQVGMGVGDRDVQVFGGTDGGVEVGIVSEQGIDGHCGFWREWLESRNP